MRNGALLDGYGDWEPPVACLCILYAAPRIPLVPFPCRCQKSNSLRSNLYVLCLLHPHLSVSSFQNTNDAIQNPYRSMLSCGGLLCCRVQTLTDRGLNAPWTLMWRLKGAKMQIQIKARSRAPVQQLGPAMPARTAGVAWLNDEPF